MSGRRLPLHASSNPAARLDPQVRHRLPGRSIAVADTQTCELALRWAARLTSQLALRAIHPHVLLTSYDAQIEVSAAQRGAFGAAAQLHSLALASTARADDLPGDERSLWVMVGQPALLSFESSLSVLLATSVPVLRWPGNMRSLRGRCTLELGADGLEIASALARILPIG